MKRLLSILLALCLILSGLTALAENGDTYTATAQGFGGEITVSLTIEDGKLTNVVVEGPDETQGVGSNAVDMLPGIMLKANSVDVDAISGCTISSTAILTAAKEALAASGIELTAAEVAPAETAMTPGTYTGEAYGKWQKGSIEGERFGSPAIIEPTRVSVTVDEHSILSVEVESCSDTPGFMDPCIERIPAAIVENQSIDVDVVTGATLTSRAILNGVAQALEAAGADPVDFMKPVPKSDAEETYETDIVVIGAGAAGTMAAIEAMEAGVDCIVLEKTGKLGGTSVCSTGFAGIQSKMQQEAGVDTFTVDSAFRELMDFCKWRANGPLVYNILQVSGPNADRLQAYWDQTDDPGITKAGETAHDTGKGTYKFDVLYHQFLEPAGVNVMLETTAKRLIVEDGAVVGVEAEKQDGTKVTVRAKKMLVCTGGFGGNDEMLRKYIGHDNFYLNGLSSNVGDGVNMCLEIGAILSDEVSPHLAEFCSNKKVDFYAGYMKFMNQAGFLALDPSGERFVNEEFFVTQALSYGASALRRVGFAYLVFTQAQLDAMTEKGLYGVLSEETIDSLKLRKRILVPSYYTLPDEMTTALEAGEAWKADTLEELGEAIGFADQSIYRKNIADYLKVLETGEDPLFGKRADMMPDLSEGPYYAVRVISAIDGTYNGIRVNENLQAVNSDYQPIDGLYVAGQDSGGFFSYPYYEGVGWTQGYAWNSGSVAAKHMIASIKGDTEDTETGAGYTEEVVSIPSTDYDIPATICIPAGDGPFPAVVMLHGTGSNRDEAGNGYLYAAPVLAEKYGIATIRIDFPGNGDSTADYMQYNFKSAVADAKAAAEYMAGLDAINGDAIGVMGWSQGGTDALLACAWEPETFKSIVTWAGAPDMMLDGFFGQEQYDEAKENGFFVMEFDWRDSLNVSLDWCDDVANTDVLAEFEKGYSGPVLAIAGTNDDTVDPVWSEKIVAASSNEKSATYFIEGMDHTFNVFAEEDLHSLYDAVDATGAFFAETLG